MPVCKGKTKLGKRCKVKSKNVYCKRHSKRGGVKTDIGDLDKHISKFLDLGTLGKMQQLSKQHKKTIKKQQEKRRFDNWVLLQNFNTENMNSVDATIIGVNYGNIHKNKEFINLVLQQPISVLTIKNILKVQEFIRNKDLKVQNLFLIAKMTLEYSKNNPHVAFISTNIEKYVSFIKEFRENDEYIEYIPKLKYYINENVKLL